MAPSNDWCPTCEETCQDHPFVCTICGENLSSRPSASSSAQQQQQQQQGRSNEINHHQQQYIRMLEQVATVAANANGGGGTTINLPNQLLNMGIPSQQTGGTEAGGGGGDMWETPPPEALNPTAQKPKSRPTSKECLGRIPRLKIEQHSAVLHEAIVECVLPPPIIGSELKRKSVLLNAMVAEFGPCAPYEITGSKLILANPVTGGRANTTTTTTTELQNDGNTKKGGIIYMERGGGKTFASKALAAQYLGASAVVIGNNVAVWPYVMRDSKKESLGKLNIPVVMVKRSDGNYIRTLLEKHKGTATITCSIKARKCNGSGENGGGCVVCRDGFEIGDTVIRLPFCAHVFHENCGLMWLNTHNTCPYCRRELPTDDEDYERERRRLNRTHASAGGDGGEEGSSNQWESLFG